MHARLARCDAQIAAHAKNSPAAQRAGELLGVGPVTASRWRRPFPTPGSLGTVASLAPGSASRRDSRGPVLRDAEWRRYVLPTSDSSGGSRSSRHGCVIRPGSRIRSTIISPPGRDGSDWPATSKRSSTGSRDREHDPERKRILQGGPRPAPGGRHSKSAAGGGQKCGTMTLE